MNLFCKTIIAAVLGVVALCNGGQSEAADAPKLVVLKPMSGPGASIKSLDSMLDLKLGSRQAVSYFQNADGLCQVTVMVAEAFNGVDAPDSTTVRFQVAIDAGRTARMDTAEGDTLEFVCNRRAEEMSVKVGNQGSAYPPGT